ncbi:MAG: hypothetical protein U9O96_07245 [Candidatus Thermoplasmatota archaeon]|nr:hypothetical protein [Candidatus Thermoplasmatota archaeon]
MSAKIENMLEHKIGVHPDKVNGKSPKGMIAGEQVVHGSKNRNG